MIRVIGLALVLALGTAPFAVAADDDDDDTVLGAEKVQATLTALDYNGYKSIKKEEQGVYEIDDAKCKMGTVDIKLDKEYTVLLISRY